MVIFTHEQKRYPKKNFTNLFGCKTQLQTHNKLQKITLYKFQKIRVSKIYFWHFL